MRPVGASVREDFMHSLYRFRIRPEGQYLNFMIRIYFRSNGKSNVAARSYTQGGQAKEKRAGGLSGLGPQDLAEQGPGVDTSANPTTHE